MYQKVPYRETWEKLLAINQTKETMLKCFALGGRALLPHKTSQRVDFTEKPNSTGTVPAGPDSPPEQKWTTSLRALYNNTTSAFFFTDFLLYNESTRLYPDTLYMLYRATGALLDPQNPPGTK